MKRGLSRGNIVSKVGYNPPKMEKYENHPISMKFGTWHNFEVQNSNLEFFCIEVRQDRKKIQRYEVYLISMKINTKDNFGVENLNLELVFTSCAIFEACPTEKAKI